MKTPSVLVLTMILFLGYCCPLTAQDNVQIGLPEGAITRISKGSLGEVHFTPDGSKLAVSSSIGIWFHDPQTGKELELLQRPNIRNPYAFAFSPDSNIIAVGIREKKSSGSIRYPVELWNSTTGKGKEMPLGHLHRLKSLAFSSDAKYVASVGGFSNTDRLWNAQTGKSITVKRMHAKGVNLVLFSLDGPIFATVGYDNAIYLWDGKTGNHRITLTGHTKHVTSAAYSPDSQTIATSSKDGTIRLWNATTGNLNITLSAEETMVCLTYSSDGNTIASGSINGNVQLWDTRTMKLKSTLTGHKKSIKSIAYAPDGKTIATASWDKTVRLWDAVTGRTKAILTGYMRIDSAEYSPDGNTIATVCQDGKVRLWEAQTAKIKTTFTVSKYGGIGKIAYSPDGETIAATRPRNTVFLVDTQTGKRKVTLKHFGLIDSIIAVIQDRESAISSIAYSPDGRTIVTGVDCYTHEKGTLYLWNAKTGRRKRTLFKGVGGVRNVAFSQDGNKIIATGDWNKKTRVWNAKTGKELRPTHDDIPRKIKRVLHSPDGTATAHVEENGTVLIRKRETTSQKE